MHNFWLYIAKVLFKIVTTKRFYKNLLHFVFFGHTSLTLGKVFLRKTCIPANLRL